MNSKAIVKFFFSVISWIFRLVFFASAAGLILLVSYFLGYSYLQGLKGNDSLYHLSNIFWFDRYFPRLPYWYPLQNGGVVPIWGYPFLFYYLIIVAHRLTDISLVSIFQIFGFLSVPLTALGLYLFIWLRIKNQTMALIAAVFYVLMPISWTWLYDWGFYTEATSYIFIFPTLIFYDSFLQAYWGGKMGFKARAAFFLAAVFLAITFLSHPSSFFVTATIAVFWTIFQAVRGWPLKIWSIVKNTAIPLGLFILVTFGLISFIFFDFYSYASTVPSAPSSGEKETFIEQYPTPVKSLLGLEKIPPTEFKYGHRNIVVPLVVWIPAILGILGAILFSRKILALALLSALPVIYFQWPILAWYTGRIIPFSGYIITHRTILIFIRLLVPIVAAYGLWTLFTSLLDLPTFWIRNGKKKLIKTGLLILITSIGSMILAVFLIGYLADKPQSLWGKVGTVRYGPEAFDIRKPFLNQNTADRCKLLQLSDPGRPKACDIQFVNWNLDIDPFLSVCEKFKIDQPAVCEQIRTGQISEAEFNLFGSDCSFSKYPTLCPYLRKVDLKQIAAYLTDEQNWPRPKLLNNIDLPPTRFSDFINKHKDDKFLRIDVSPYLGGVVQSLNLQSDISQINLYAVTLSLLGPYWGYEQQVFFSKNTGDTVNVNNLAKYFGTKYLFLESQLDPITKYASDSAHWKEVDEAGVWEFADAPRLYSWTRQKPTALVIGSSKVRAFEPLFRVAVNGGYNFDDGLLVQGKDNIDDYSLDQLKQFDILVLFGYSYKSQDKAYSLLREYLQSGGNIFLSTGWQYNDKDWQIKKAPEFFPVTDLTWNNQFTGDSKYVLEDKQVGGDVDVAKFSPLRWSEGGWGVSVPTIGKKDWARAVLSVDGKPLVVAGEVGKGKIVWTGLNLIGHIATYEFNKEEIKFFRNLMLYLKNSPEDESVQSARVTALRDYPDKVEFTFNDSLETPSNFYWRETQYKNWHASLVDIQGSRKSLDIYRAGPGFMFMKLPPLEQGSKLVLEFKPGLRTIIGTVLSILTLICLSLYIFFGQRLTAVLTKLSSIGIEKMKGRVKTSLTRTLGSLKDEEDNY